MIKNKRRGEKGQSFVELAMTLLFLLILLSATVDLGWAFYTMITLRDAVQEAASYGSICAFNKDSDGPNTELIEQRLLLSVTEPIDMADVEDIDVSFTDEDGNVVAIPEMSGAVVVRATVQHHIVTPFVGAFIGRYEYPLTAEVADTVMRSKWLNQCDYE